MDINQSECIQVKCQDESTHQETSYYSVRRAVLNTYISSHNENPAVSSGKTARITKNAA